MRVSWRSCVTALEPPGTVLSLAGTYIFYDRDTHGEGIALVDWPLKARLLSLGNSFPCLLYRNNSRGVSSLAYFKSE